MNFVPTALPNICVFSGKCCLDSVENVFWWSVVRKGMQKIGFIYRLTFFISKLKTEF